VRHVLFLSFNHQCISYRQRRIDPPEADKPATLTADKPATLTADKGCSLSSGKAEKAIIK